MPKQSETTWIGAARLSCGPRDVSNQYLCVPQRAAASPQLNGKGWIISLLPQLEQPGLYDQFVPGFIGDFFSGGGLMNPVCRNAMKTQLAVLECPSDPSVLQLSDQDYVWMGIPVAVTSYKGVIGDTQVGGTLSAWQGTLPTCEGWTGCNGMFYRCDYQDGGVSIDNISDGTSNTLMVGEDVPAQNRYSVAFIRTATGRAATGRSITFPIRPLPTITGM